MGSNSAEKQRNVRNGKVRQCCILIGPILAKYLDIDNIGSGEELDTWSAHDESDE